MTTLFAAALILWQVVAFSHGGEIRAVGTPVSAEDACDAKAEESAHRLAKTVKGVTVVKFKEAERPTWVFQIDRTPEYHTGWFVTCTSIEPWVTASLEDRM